MSTPTTIGPTQQARSFADFATEDRDNLLGMVLNHVDTHIFIKDADGRYLYANPKVCEGLQLPLEQILGHTDDDLMPGEVAAEIIKFDRQVLASQRALRREELVVSTTGVTRNFLSEKVPVRQPDGTFILIGFATEITALKSVEAALRASETDLHRTLENLPFPIVLIEAATPGQWTNLSARCLFFNRSWIDTLGYEITDARTAEELTHHLYPDAQYRREVWERRTAASHQAATNGGIAPVFEVCITAKDGTVHHMLTGTSVVGRRMIVSLQDITELRQQQEALRISEERHRFLAEAARDTLWTIEPDGRVSFVSPSVEVVRGFTPEEAMAHTLEQTHPPESLDRVRRWWGDMEAAVAARRRPADFRAELAYYCKDGSLLWTEVMAYALLHPDGSLAQVIGVTRDMSERKRAEQQLQRSESKFRTLFEAGRQALLLMNEEGRFLDANPSAWRLFGCSTREAIVGELWTDLSLDEQPCGTASKVLARQHLQRAADGEDVTFEWVHRFGPGQLGFPCEVMLTRIDIDGRPVLLASVEDLTAKKKAAAALTRSEEHYRLLSSNLHDTVLHLSDEGVVTWITPSLEKALGYAPEEWIGRRIIDIIVPEDAPRAQSNIVRCIKEEKPVIARYAVRNKAGRRHETESYATPYLKDGVRDGIVVSFHLIDAQIAIEAELERRARTDDLTNLLNRREVFDRIRHVTGANHRTGREVAVLFCDLDKFKEINDTHGHHTGDEVLVALAPRLRGALRNQDDVAARLGGDELMVVLHGVRDEADAMAVAEKLRLSVAEPITTSAGPVRITMSIGVALARANETTEQLVSRADAAMYQAKQTGRKQVVPVR